MPILDVVVRSNAPLSIRAKQLASIFDCPADVKQEIRWQADLPIEQRKWNVGLIVGPSGCGKSTCARQLWPDEFAWKPEWNGPTLIDCFDSNRTLEDISAALGSVGFSTVPAWLRPYDVLSNGEKFRAEIAKRLMEQSGVIVIDEFTSVVDRQVATVACHAVQKFVRRKDRQLVAVTCHNDVEEWLQPDWVFEPATRTFRWRSVRPRPQIPITICPIDISAWKLFAPFHYMSADINRSAKCFGLYVGDSLASFAGVLHMPHAQVANIKRVTRAVTLPDFQGLGLVFHLLDTLGAAYKAIGQRLRTYPAHPSFVRSFKKEKWLCVKRPGTFQPMSSMNRKQLLRDKRQAAAKELTVGFSLRHSQRPCATFEYVGQAMDRSDAEKLLR